MSKNLNLDTSNIIIMMKTAKTLKTALVLVVIFTFSTCEDEEVIPVVDMDQKNSRVETAGAE